MFGTIYALMQGELAELPRRRADPTIEFDRVAGGFVATDGRDHDTSWLGRGEIPGTREANATLEREGRTVADEMRELALRPTR